MKKILIPICFLLGISVFAQESEIPSNILSAFKLKYPDAEDVVWKLQKDFYQVEFFDFYQSTAVYNRKGLWERTIALVSEDELPETAFDFIDETYEVSQILQVQMIEDNMQTISYKVMILDEDQKVSLKFSEEGSLIE